MPIILRNDEQIKVGTTVGLVAGANSFQFDGTSGKLDYRKYNIVVSEITGRGIMVLGVDYSWNSTTGLFTLLQSGDVFQQNQWYNFHFEPLEQTVIVTPTNIVNASFFVRDINIPNIATVGPILDRLNSFIVRYETQCLRRILGHELYEAFITESSQRMTELLYGADYTDYYGNKVRWYGLVHDVDISLIAYYIYYYYQEVSATTTTGVAEASSLSEAAVTVSPAEKMINAWNLFSKEVLNMVGFIMSKNSGSTKTYPEFTYNQSIETIDYSRPNNLFGF